jgi:putative membrane protein
MSYEANRVMGYFAAATRRLFPPLKIKAKLFIAIALLTIYGMAVKRTVDAEHLPKIEWGAESTILNGLVLSFLVAFRNKHAYDQWWEARKLWGNLINESRNLLLKVRALDVIDPAERDRLAALVIGFGRALKRHLRRRATLTANSTDTSPTADQAHEPLKIAGDIYETVARWHRRGWLDGWTLLWLDAQVKGLIEICGGCERIQNTPLSTSYRALLRHAIVIYLLVSPFYLFEDTDTGFAGFSVFLLAAYFLWGIETVAEEIEDPFGTRGDDLPLERYCDSIETSAREILGPTAVPSPRESASQVPRLSAGENDV